MRSWSRFVNRVVILLAIAMLLPGVFGQTSPPAGKSAADFAPLQQWKNVVLSGNAAALKALYSTNPPAQIVTPAGQTSGDSDVAFWIGLKVRRMKFAILQSDSPQNGVHQVVFQAEVRSGVSGEHTVYITEGQLWQQQGEQWRLAATKRSDPTRLQQPTSTSKVIYAPGLDAHAEIKQALALASKEHKRVLVVFGANWCYDCHVLDLAFHRPDIEPVLHRRLRGRARRRGRRRQEPGPDGAVPGAHEEGNPRDSRSRQRWQAALQPAEAASSRKHEPSRRKTCCRF